MGRRRRCRGRRKKPREWAGRPAVESVSWVLASENGEKAVGQLALLARAGSGDKYGVIAGDGADDLGPARGVDGNCHALRRTHGGFQYRQIRTGGQAGADELLERREIAFRSGARLGEHIAIAHLGHAELAQIPAHARLSGNMTMFAQYRDQLSLPPDGL